MDRILDWLSTEFPPGWFDGMKLAPDWLSIVNFVLVAFLGWKTLGPRRKTKLKFMLGTTMLVDDRGGEGYHELLLTNEGHFPAHNVRMEIGGRESWGFDVGDLVPWEVKSLKIAVRNMEGTIFRATYHDPDNKLNKVRLKFRGNTFMFRHEESNAGEEVKYFFGKD